MMHAKWLEDLRPALIAVGFLLMPARLFAYGLRPATLAAGFFAAFAVYFADHSLPAHSKWAWPVIVISSAVFLWMFFLSGQFSVPGIMGYVGLALLYVLPVLPGRKRLQDFPILRVLAVVCGWSLMPLLVRDFRISPLTLMYIWGMAALLLPALLWSDLADADTDHRHGRNTWSMGLTRRNRNGLLIGFLLLSVLCFSHPQLRLLLPVPLLYLAGLPFFNRHPQYSDWVLLWPLLSGMFI
jgi:hypothetical protein